MNSHETNRLIAVLLRIATALEKLAEIQYRGNTVFIRDADSTFSSPPPVNPTL